jgi:hypothetical protein
MSPNAAASTQPSGKRTRSHVLQPNPMAAGDDSRRIPDAKHSSRQAGSAREWHVCAVRRCLVVHGDPRDETFVAMLLQMPSEVVRVEASTGRDLYCSRSCASHHAPQQRDIRRICQVPRRYDGGGG